MSTLADLIRTAAQSNLTRNQLKVLRAKLRRAGVTNLNKDARGPYTINPDVEGHTDVRAEYGIIVAQTATLVTTAA